ncbi:MAG: hypothetical protein IT434_18315 [Phycisphaerales bacterium]|nr:hypothetical protein [Phycisphaerales bacterium]
MIAEEQGVVVSSQTIKEEGDDTRFRGVGIIDGEFYHVLTVLHDVPRFTEWMYKTIEARTLKNVDSHAYIIYSRVDAPWPFQDRDAVVLARARVIVPGKKAIGEFEGIQSPLMGKVKGVVRFPTIKGHYLIEAVTPKQTRVTYQVEADPGGWIPRWAARRANKELPLFTLLSLREQVKKTKGYYDKRIKELYPEAGKTASK